MKARVKSTGEIVEVTFLDRKTHTDEQVYMTCEGNLIEESRLDFNVEEIDYWTRLEHTYAGMAMQGFCANYNDFTKVNDGTCTNVEMICENARIIAHALVEKMKEEK